jgi:hypothetical protein
MPWGLVFGLAHCGQQERGEDRDAGHDDQHLDENEGGASASPGWRTCGPNPGPRPDAARCRSDHQWRTTGLRASVSHSELLRTGTIRAPQRSALPSLQGTCCRRKNFVMSFAGTVICFSPGVATSLTGSQGPWRVGAPWTVWFSVADAGQLRHGSLPRSSGFHPAWPWLEPPLQMSRF